ncbi:MAG: O-antigen ligase family protein [Candidatus Omnitrophica bacterium]|nr:O-antigen ligase family protein [Candidatus Omnitrophota bacterium]
MPLIFLIDRGIFLLLCFLVFFLPSSNAIVQIFSGLLIFFYLVKKFCIERVAGRLATFDRAVFWPLLLFLGWALLTVFISHYPVLSLRAFVGKLMKVAGLMVITYEALNSCRRINIFIGFLLTAAMIIVLDSLWQMYSGHDFFVHSLYISGRVMASFKHPNDLGAYLVFMILPALVLVFVFCAETFKQYSGLKVFRAFGWGALTVLLVAVLGQTYSRGAWLGSTVAVLVFLFFARRFWFLLLGGVALFGAVFLPMLFQHRNVSFISESAGNSCSLSGSGRIGYWEDAIRIIAEHPVFGTGINTYTQVIKTYNTVWKAYPHNCYLQMGAELGLVGLGLFLWFLGAVITVIARQLWNMPKQPYRWLCAAFFAGWCGVLAHSALDTTFYSSQLSVLLWVMTGFILAFSTNGIEVAYGKE